MLFSKNKTRIIPACKDENLYKEAEIFLRPKEKFFCTLMNHIVSHEDDVYVITTNNKITGVFYFNGSTLSPYLPRNTKEISLALKDYLSWHNVYCLSGEEKSVSEVQSIMESLGKKTSQVRSMYLLQYNSKKRRIPLPEGTTLITCTPFDADALMPLQKAFAKEEVLPPGREMLPYVERKVIDEVLKEGKILALKKDDFLCAKAHSSPGYLHYIQIGGVYTKPSERNKGMAAYLVQELSLYAQSEKKHAVLFVRKENLPAIKSYQKAGFVNCGHYRITYY